MEITCSEDHELLQQLGGPYSNRQLGNWTFLEQRGEDSADLGCAGCLLFFTFSIASLLVVQPRSTYYLSWLTVAAFLQN